MAAKKVGTLAMFVTANTSSFQQKMATAKKTTLSLGKSMVSVGAQAVKYGAALGGAAVAGGLALARVQSKAIDENAKLSDQIGISIERLQGYQFAAELTGVSLNEINKSLEKQTIVVAQASKGYGPAIKAFDLLGLEAKELIKLKPEMQFEKIADAVSNMSNRTEAAAAVSEIFGSRNQKLINTLSMGSEGLREVQKELKEMGIVYDRLGAKQVENANDALAKNQLIFKGIGSALAVQLSPAVTVLTNKMTSFIKESGGIEKVVVKGLTLASKGVAFFAQGWTGAKVAFLTAKVAAGGFVKFFIANINDAIQVTNKLFKALGSDALSNTAAFSKGLTEGINEGLIKDVKDLKTEFKNLVDGKAVKDVERFFGKIKEESRKAAAAQLETTKQASQGTSLVNRLGGLASGLGSSVGSRIENTFEAAKLKVLEKTSSAYKTLIKVRDQYNKGQARALELLKATRSPQQVLKDDLKEVSELMRQGHLTMQQAQKVATNIFNQSAPSIDQPGFGKQAAVVDTRNVSIESLRAVNGQDVDKKQLNQLEQMKDILERMLGELNSPPVFQ